MHLILTGPTGTIGTAVLDAMIKRTDITKISVLSRRPVKFAEDAKDPRVNVILHQDFEKYDPSLMSQLQGASGCVWALGISQTQVTKSEYIKITKTMALEAAKAFRSLSSEKQPFNFVYVSGAGATTTPGMFTTLFGRVKGETELELAALREETPHFHALSIRPAMVDTVQQPDMEKYMPSKPWVHHLSTGVMGPLIRSRFKSFWSPTGPLGQFLTELAMGKHASSLVNGKGVAMIDDFPILENEVFARLQNL